MESEQKAKMCFVITEGGRIFYTTPTAFKNIMSAEMTTVGRQAINGETRTLTLELTVSEVLELKKKYEQKRKQIANTYKNTGMKRYTFSQYICEVYADKIV